MGGKTERKKELLSEYKQRAELGGVFKIVNTKNGRYFLDATPNLAGMKNRFEFFISTGSCFHPKLAGDFKAYGAGVFEFAVLEELEKKESQSAEEFKDDLNTLKALWLEKLDPSGAY
jgi:hypothetical protein